MAIGTVLIVEDSHYLARAISDVVKDLGYDTIIVPSGEEALDALSTETLDLVLLDWILPGIAGLEVLQNIRQGPKADLPVIMLTAKGEIDARVEGLEAGADDYITKPVHMKELQARISAVLRRKE